LGSFSHSFSRGVKRGVRRSASFVQLVWSYPTGWQPQRGGGQRQRHLPQEVEGKCRLLDEVKCVPIFCLATLLAKSTQAKSRHRSV
jgi:hypothetical protein